MIVHEYLQPEPLLCSSGILTMFQAATERNSFPSERIAGASIDCQGSAQFILK